MLYFIFQCIAFNELDKLKAFNNLSYKSRNKENFENFKSNAVGRITNLKVLNKIDVTEVCRRGAEYDLWKSSFGLEWLNATTDEERKEIAKKCRAYPRTIASNKPTHFLSFCINMFFFVCKFQNMDCLQIYYQ